MARGVNKVILVGNLGGDPETRFFPSGGAVTNVTVATSDSWKDKQTGEPRESTEWHRVVFNGRLAEIAGEYLKKGSKVYIEGSLNTRKWQDKNTGQDRYTTEIRAREMQMLDSRGGQGDYQQQGGSSSQPQQQSYQQPQQSQPQSQSPQQSQQQAPQQAQSAPSGGFDDFDDDIPF